MKPEKFCGIFVFVLMFALAGIHFASASEITPQKVIELANSDRRDKGLGELEENDKLEKVAADKAEDMVTDDYFAHNAPDGTTPWHWFDQEKYDYNYAGENLAMDFLSAEKMNQAWLDSPTHRANILNDKYRDIGVGVKEGVINGHDTVVVVQVFGSGDKSVPEKPKEKTVSEKKSANTKNKVPDLPLEEISSISYAKHISLAPIITSPENGENISGDATNIFGRAEAGARVSLFDGKKMIAETVADKKGWFRVDASDFDEGNHSLTVQSEKNIGEKKEIKASSAKVAVAVDAAKPKINFELSAGRTSDEVILRVSSGKPNSIFDIGGKIVYANSGEYVLGVNKQSRLSLSIKAEDTAGNKDFQEVNIAGFYQRQESFDMAEKIASVFQPQKVYAAESGMTALRSNLGLAEGNER